MNPKDFLNYISVVLAFNLAYVFLEKRNKKRNDSSINSKESQNDKLGFFIFLHESATARVERLALKLSKDLVETKSLYERLRYYYDSNPIFKEYSEIVEGKITKCNNLMSETTTKIKDCCNAKRISHCCLSCGIYCLILLLLLPFYGKRDIVLILFILNAITTLCLVYGVVWDSIPTARIKYASKYNSINTGIEHINTTLNFIQYKIAPTEIVILIFMVLAVLSFHYSFYNFFIEETLKYFLSMKWNFAYAMGIIISPFIIYFALIHLKMRVISIVFKRKYKKILRETVIDNIKGKLHKENEEREDDSIQDMFK